MRLRGVSGGAGPAGGRRRVDTAASAAAAGRLCVAQALVARTPLRRSRSGMGPVPIVPVAPTVPMARTWLACLAACRGVLLERLARRVVPAAAALGHCVPAIGVARARADRPARVAALARAPGVRAARARGRGPAGLAAKRGALAALRLIIAPRYNARCYGAHTPHGVFGAHGAKGTHGADFAILPCSMP